MVWGMIDLIFKLLLRLVIFFFSLGNVIFYNIYLFIGFKDNINFNVFKIVIIY